jgi:hypothetical protein
VRKRIESSPAGWPLALTGAITLTTFVAALIGLLVDPRVITGAPAWLKPAKFGLSIAIYSFTLLWLLSFVRGRARIVGIVAWVSAIGLLLEQSIIVAQVVRGTASHFNVGTELDSLLFNIMGSTIVVVWLMGLVAAVLLVRQRLDDSDFALSLKLGIAIALVGMAVAVLMTSANPAQQAAASQRARSGMAKTSGAHSVGVAEGDGGAGLPIVGWSTEGGDLRVAHFVGIHAINVLPLIGWALARTGLQTGRRRALVWTAGLGYLGLVGVLTWQALRGQSLVAPDGQTVLGAAGLLMIVVVACLATLLTPRALTSQSMPAN